MILIASSQGEASPIEASEETLEFFKQSSVLNAQIFLNSYFESEKIECSVSTALTTSLMHGSFLWTNSLTPSGLASSVITSSDIIRADTLHEGIVLDYSTKYEMNSSSLAKLTKTQILFPVDVESTIERLKAFHALVKLFLGKLSYPQQGLRRLVNLCSDNRRLLRTRQYLDDMFIPKFLFSVDDRLNQWLHQCCTADSIMDTNLELTNFSSIFNDIQMNKFVCHLPPNIMKLHKRDTEDQSDDEFGRKKKKKSQQVAEQVKNLSQVHGWKLRHNEKWDTIFKNKSRDGPQLSGGVKPCLKYHVKGVCYTDCPFRQSHKQLVGEDKRKIERLINELRGE